MKAMRFCKYKVLLFLLLIVTGQLYSQDCTVDLQKFLNGEREVFLSEGLPQANGLKLRMEYPKGWSKRDGKRPNVLQFFKSPELFEMASISVFEISKLYDITLEELEANSNEISDELMSDAMMKSSLKINNDVEIEEYKFSKTRLDNINAVVSSCKISNPGNADIGKIRMFSQLYMLVYKDYYVVIQYMIQQHSYESEDLFNKRIDCYKPLLSLMANSVIILNKYEY